MGLILLISFILAILSEVYFLLLGGAALNFSAVLINTFLIFGILKIIEYYIEKVEGKRNKNLIMGVSACILVVSAVLFFITYNIIASETPYYWSITEIETSVNTFVGLIRMAIGFLLQMLVFGAIFFCKLVQKIIEATKIFDLIDYNKIKFYKRDIKILTYPAINIIVFVIYFYTIQHFIIAVIDNSIKHLIR